MPGGASFFADPERSSPTSNITSWLRHAASGSDMLALTQNATYLCASCGAALVSLMKVLIVGTVGACEHCRAYFEIQGGDVKNRNGFALPTPGHDYLNPGAKYLNHFFGKLPLRKCPGRATRAGRAGQSLAVGGWRCLRPFPARGIGSHAQRLGEAGQIRGADPGTSAASRRQRSRDRQS